jgi:hypothetical protein
MLIGVGPRTQAAPVDPAAGLRPASDVSARARVHVSVDRRSCEHPDGRRGRARPAGWYRCNLAFRHGLGWSGVQGRNGWRHGPDDRRRERLGPLDGRVPSSGAYFHDTVESRRPGAFQSGREGSLRTSPGEVDRLGGPR